MLLRLAENTTPIFANLARGLGPSSMRQIAKNGLKILPHAEANWRGLLLRNGHVRRDETIGSTLCLTIEIYYPHIQTRKICNNSSCNVVSKRALLPHVRLRLPSINHMPHERSSTGGMGCLQFYGQKYER